MSDDIERRDFEEWCRDHLGSRDQYGLDSSGEYEDKFVQGAYNVWRAARAQGEPPSRVTALTSDLSARINRVSRRSLDGSVVMSSDEWNGIVELVEKLLTATPAAPAVECGGVPHKDALKAACTDFFYWWYNAPGSNTQQGFDEWFDEVGFKHFTTHPHNGEQGGEWVRCEERLPNTSDGDERCSIWVSGLYENTGRRFVMMSFVGEAIDLAQKGAIDHFMPTGLTRPQPPKSKEDRGHEIHRPI